VPTSGTDLSRIDHPPQLEAHAPTSALRGLNALPEEPFWAGYWRVLKKRRWVVLSAVMIVSTCVGFATFRETRVYQAVGRIAWNRPASEILLGFKDVGATISQQDTDDSAELATQVHVLQSNTLILQVAKKLGLDRSVQSADRQANGQVILSAQPSAKTRAAETAMVSKFGSGLRIFPVPDTRVLEIRYSSPDPEFAAKAVNTLVDTYIEQNVKSKFESTMQAADWLSQQLGDLRLKVEVSQEKLMQYQKQNNLLGIDEKQTLVTAKLDDFNKQLTEAESDRIQKEAEYQSVLLGKPEMIAGDDATSLIGQLRQQQLNLQGEYAQLSSAHGEKYPRMREIRDQLKHLDSAIKAENKNIIDRVQQRYVSAQQREAALRALVEKQKAEANQLNESTVQYNLLKRDFETNRQLYEELLQKMKEAGISAGLKSTNVRVIDVATIPTVPTTPNIPRNLSVGFLLGLMGGVGLAFVIETLDNTVRTPEQVQMLSALPSLGLIPLKPKYRLRLKGNGKNGSNGSSADIPVALISLVRPKSELAESFRSLRTSILLSSSGAPPKVLTVSSALPGEGKTTTSFNLAIVLAQKGARVLLIDADIRRPGIHKVLGIRRKDGLSTLLAGRDTPENVVLPWAEIPNLYVLPAGPSVPNPAELLGSHEMRTLLNLWREEFDHIIVDTPPILSVTDAAVLSPEVDRVVLVIRSGRTTREALRHARDVLLQVQARILGVVVNAVDLGSPDLYYYYYRSEYSSKYYVSDGPTGSGQGSEDTVQA
jgi:polysaccharide biosynthesis transport protein